MIAPARLALLTGLVVAASVATARPGWAHGPHDTTTAVAVSPAFGSDQTILAAFHFTNNRMLGRSTDGGLTWELTVPAVALDAINALAFSPDFSTDGVIFAATEDGGVHRTDDAGLTWSPTNTGLPATAVDDLAVSPDFATDGTVAVATPLGVYLSTDGGATWQPTGPGLVGGSARVVRFGADASTLWAGASRVHLSVDGGQTWVPLADAGRPMVDLEVDAPAGPGTATLVTCFGRLGGGVLASTDGGATLAPSVTGMPDARVNDLAIASDGTLLAADATTGCLTAPGVFSTWTFSQDGLQVLSPQTSSHFLELAPSPDFARDDRIILVGFEGVFDSSDRGLTWEQRETYSIKLNRWVEVPPDFPATGRVYLGSYGGSVLEGRIPMGAPAAPAPSVTPAALATPGGPSAAPAPGKGPRLRASPAPHPPTAADVEWRAIGVGIDIFSSALAIAPGDPAGRTIFYGYNDLYRSDDGGASWLHLPAPAQVFVMRAFGVSPDYPDDQRVLLGTAGEGLWESNDAGATWQLLDDATQTGEATRIVYSPDHANDATIFLATKDEGVHRTEDDGATWQALAASPESVRDLVVSPDFAIDETLWAGTIGDGLWVSTDRGDTWGQVAGGMPTTHNIVEGLAVSPAYASDRTLFAASQTHGVLASTDGGATWEHRESGLPGTAVRRITLSPDFVHDRTLLLTTYDWVWISRDAGASWTRLNAMLRPDNIHQSVWHFGDWISIHIDHDEDHAASDGGGPDGGEPEPAGPAYGTDTAISSAGGDAVALRFFGERVAWYSARGPDGGIVSVELDGVPVATIDLYAPVQEWNVEAFRRELGPADWHLLRVVNTGTAHPASTGIEVHDDGFAYWN